jgi:hypothetical protein
MAAIRGTYLNGQIVLDGPPPADWPDGAEVRVELAATNGPLGARDDDRPPTPEEIADTLAKMDQVQGPFLSPEDEAAWQQARAEQKAWEISNWDKHNKEIEDLFR